MKSLFQEEKIKLQLFEKRIVRFRNISLKGVERGASSQGTRFDFPPPPAGLLAHVNIIIQCFMGFCGRVTNRSGNRDAGVSTNSPCRDINDTTVSSLLSLSLSRVQRAIFFFIPFFFPPRTSSRELVMVGSRWNCSFSREREEEARRWWFIVPSRDSLNWGGDFGIFFFSLSRVEKRKEISRIFRIFLYHGENRVENCYDFLLRSIIIESS